VQSTIRNLLPHFRPVWQLALPVIIANLLQSLVNVTAVFMAGRLGPVEIAAIGMASSVNMLILVAFMSITAGSMTLAAQAIGARNPAALSNIARQSISLGLVMWLVLGSAGLLLARPILAFLNGAGDPLAVQLGSQYLQIMFAGIIFLVLNLTISALMQGAGDTVTPLLIATGMNVVNIALNFALMFGAGPFPELGVPGAAIGTVAARALGVLAGLLVLYSGRNVVKILPGTYRPDWKAFREILAIGIPSGLQGLVRNSAQILVLRTVTSTAAGTFGASALAIGLQIESLAFMPGLAISVAATSLVGSAVGGWQIQSARQRGNASVVLGLAVMTAIAIPVVVFAPRLLLLFDPSAHPTVQAAGVSYIRINGLVLPLLALSMVGNGALRGAGDTTPGMYGAIISRWLIVVPLAWFLALRLDIGVNGVWWALAAGTLVQAAFVLAHWSSQHWKRVAMRKSRLWRLHLRHLPEPAQQQFLDEIKAPLMALDHVSEHVSTEGVTYRLPEGRIHFEFDGGNGGDSGYRVTGGHGLLGRIGDSPTLTALRS
jgi:putative MATE family efflux protein